MHEFMVTMDPPQHDDYRSLMWRLFTPKQMKKNESFMWRLADEKIDEFIDEGKVEFGGQYSSPFAGLVIADLLGVPEEDMPRFRAWFDGQLDRLRQRGATSRVIRWPSSRTRSLATSPNAAGIRGTTYSPTSPRPGSPTGRCPRSRTSRESAFIFAAGQETTVRLLTFSMRYIAENPDVQQHLRDNRDLIPNFLEEMLRLESPIKVHFRMARRTTTLGGVTIPAGMSVMLVNGAANRDPRQFENPSEVQIGRANARDQLAFSRGAHSCLGSSLARSESRVTIERVLDRMGDIRVSEAHHGPADDRRWEYLPNWLFRGLTELHLEFQPIR